MCYRVERHKVEAEFAVVTLNNCTHFFALLLGRHETAGDHRVEEAHDGSHLRVLLIFHFKQFSNVKLGRCFGAGRTVYGCEEDA